MDQPPRGPITGLLRRVGRRGSVLLFLGLFDTVYAFGLAFPSERSRTNPTTLFLESVIPSLVAWSALWGLVGVVCIIGAFWKRWEPWAFSLAIGIKMLWALMFGLGQAAGVVERGWVSAAIWGMFALLVWVISGWPEKFDG